MIELKEKSVTLLLAHPDDEIIFGFGVLPYAKKIICCSNDRFNDSRPQWAYRHLALAKICQILGVELINLNYNSDFYALPEDKLKEFVETVAKLIQNESLIFTHNAWGEYKHRDHILLHDIALQIKREILTSNIMVSSDYTGFIATDSPVISDGLVCRNNLALYTRCRDIYRSYHCWTWYDRPFKNETIYLEKCKQI